MLLWSFINCYTRLYLGVHFPSDVLIGLLYGGCIGATVYILYNKVSKKLLFKKSFFSTQYTATGYAISDIEMVLIVMCLIILIPYLEVFCVCIDIIKRIKEQAKMNIKEISIKDYNYELPERKNCKFPKAERRSF